MNDINTGVDIQIRDSPICYKTFMLRFGMLNYFAVYLFLLTTILSSVRSEANGIIWLDNVNLKAESYFWPRYMKDC